jgi:hypothetical protein
VSETAIGDAALARTLLEAALATEAKPALTAAQVEVLLGMAVETGDGGAEGYTREGLNRAAALGWNWKTALVSEVYELSAGEGRTLKRQQWFDQCREMARLYGTGEMDVVTGAMPGAEHGEPTGGTVVELLMPFLGTGS